MTTSSNLLRSLVIYALVLPLALVLGYQLATPLEFSSLSTVAIIFLIISLPLLLKWHHPALYLFWNMSASVFLLPGRPEIWVLMAFLSLAICIVQRTLIQEMRFIYAPSVVWPVVFLVLVVVVTGQLTHSFGLKSLGARTVGAKNYFYILAGAAGFLAMTAHRIPQEKAVLYVSLFLLGTISNSAGMLAPYVPSWLNPLFLVFPVTSNDLDPLLTTGFEGPRMRFMGLGGLCGAISLYLLARYGIRKLFDAGNRWRLLLLAIVVAAGMFTGFRSQFILLGLTCALVAYFEGLFHSRHGVPVVFACLLGVVLLVPLADRLPLPMQRTLSFLPLKLDPIARMDAENSSQWRIEMWKMVVPEIPKYFWLGKGVGISEEDMTSFSTFGFRGNEGSREEAIVVGNYHNGPLSLLMTFGVWGAIGFIWFLGACIRALYLNYRYGEDYLKHPNVFLLASFVAKAVVFFVVFGDLRVDFAPFAGMIGLSLALNHGIRKPVYDKAPPKPIALRSRAEARLAAGLAR
jgi:hypothetical protein